MCKFFSLVSDAKGNFYYFDWKQRQEILKGKIKESADSHTSIADFYGFKGQKEDKLNKYEYNPFTKQFTVDQINTFDDSKEVEKFCKKLDFKEIVPVNFDKKIINPFKDRSILEITDEDIELLKQWASGGDSVGASVWASVWDSVWASVGDSVGASVGAYCSSFVEADYEYDFSSAIKLWELGLVPSYDGKVWRLHGGKKASILWEGKLSGGEK